MLIQRLKNKHVFQFKGIAFGFLLAIVITVILLAIVVSLHLSGNLDFLYQTGQSANELTTIDIPV